MTEKPVCVLIPGMLCTAALWQPQQDALAQLAQVKVVELTESSIDLMVQEVLSIPDRRFALAGLSLGGIVAMSIAAAAPERVSTLALLSTSARAPRPEQRIGWRKMAARAAGGEFHRITPEDLIPAMVHPDRWSDLDLVTTVTGMADQVGSAVFLRQLAAQHTRVDLTVALPAIQCPTLVIAGAADTLAPLAAHHEIAHLIPGATLEVLPRTAHLSPLENPHNVTMLLRHWLTGTRTRLTGAAPEHD